MVTELRQRAAGTQEALVEERTRYEKVAEELKEALAALVKAEEDKVAAVSE